MFTFQQFPRVKACSCTPTQSNKNLRCKLNVFDCAKGEGEACKLRGRELLICIYVSMCMYVYMLLYLDWDVEFARRAAEIQEKLQARVE